MLFSPALPPVLRSFFSEVVLLDVLPCSAHVNASLLFFRPSTLYAKFSSLCLSVTAVFYASFFTSLWTSSPSCRKRATQQKYLLLQASYLVPSRRGLTLSSFFNIIGVFSDSFCQISSRNLQSSHSPGLSSWGARAFGSCPCSLSFLGPPISLIKKFLFTASDLPLIVPVQTSEKCRELPSFMNLPACSKQLTGHCPDADGPTMS